MQATATNDKQSPTSKRAAWYKLIEEYNASGQSQISYCAQRGINKDHFAYYMSTWRKAHVTNSNTLSFLPLEIARPPLANKWMLHFGASISLELPEGTSMQQLSELIISLRKSLC
jgi:hypothetical protein